MPAVTDQSHESRGTAELRRPNAGAKRGLRHAVSGALRLLFRAGTAVRLAAAAALLLAGASCAPRAMSAKARQKHAAPVDYPAVAAAADAMLPAIRRHAEAIAGFGPRQTGQAGCERTLAYVRETLAALRPDLPIEEFGSPVTVALDRTNPGDLDRAEEPFTRVAMHRPGRPVVRRPAYALAPNSCQPCATHAPERCPWSVGAAPAPPPCRNCETPRRVVDLASGRWEDFEGKDPDGAYVLLDFNSGDAWLRAAEMGAVGAVFVMPENTTVFQADAKYLAAVPFHFPRVLLRRDDALDLRASAADPDTRLELAGRLRFRNVPGRCLAMTLPGRDRGRCYVLTAHLDARCIAPDLSYGGAEIWGAAELLELTRHLAARTNECDIAVIFTTGHWQGQTPMRDELGYGTPRRMKMGSYYRIVMGMDLDPEGRGVNLMSESAWDNDSVQPYMWLGRALFAKGGWRERILEGLRLPPGDAELFAGMRPFAADTMEDGFSDRNNRSPAIFTPRYRTADEPWQTARLTRFAFQTCRLQRLAHFTPLDRLGAPDPGTDARLGPQIQITLAVLRHLLAYPGSLLPESAPDLHHAREWGGYARIKGRVLEWDRGIGWFAERLPGAPEGTAGTTAAMQTFIQAYPAPSSTMNAYGRRLRNFLPWPMLPHRAQHRDLQCFMFQDLRMLETPAFTLNAIHAAAPDISYDVVGYALDADGRLRYATDYGIHGDGNNAFQCTDLVVDHWDMHVPVNLFECGAVELMGLVDPQRYNPNTDVPGSWRTSSSSQGMAPYLRIAGVKDVQSHTDLERYGFTQYGSTAMVFLPAAAPGDAEILLGSRFSNFAVLDGIPPVAPAGETEPAAARAAGGAENGLRVRAGESLRLAGGNRLSRRACVESLARLDRQRMAEFARFNVASPAARRACADSAAALDTARCAQETRRWRAAFANYLRAWSSETLTYRSLLRLLADVVSTTVLYFVLLIPFSFLIERLILPQRTALRSVLVSACVFAVFATLLYVFHPGFRLANNVVVTITAFLIVVMTLPALALLLMRGVAMLKAIGSKAVITQQSEAESSGVVIAALGLAVSNMRRRRLRTTLTLATITLLVVALVLLTTSSAFDFRILEPTGAAGASFEGLQILNARDHRQPLLRDMVEQYEGLLAAAGEEPPPLVLRREYINYGYDPKVANGALLLEAGSKRIPLPYLQVMDWRDNLLAYTTGESRDKKGRRVHLSDFMQGRFFEPGDTDACLLPDTMAATLGVGVGDTVTVMGLPLRVKGIWAAQERHKRGGLIPGPLDRLLDLDGQPITPMHFAKLAEGEPDSPIHAPSRMMAIVTRQWVERHAIFPSCVYSLVVVPGGADGAAAPDYSARLADLASRLSREILNVEVYTHSVDSRGRHHSARLSMHTATRVQGSSLMLVVMAAAVLMILAIMTGTVHERMREIHVFSAVGLAPRHIAGMFLVEALVYAGIASVLGYFIGIIALKALLAHPGVAGAQQEFYPNYLGVFVLYASATAVLATVASSLYPIRLARRIASPAAEHPWLFDTAKRIAADDESGQDGHFLVRLPFIATTREEARAMMVYAYDWIAMFQGERSGRFVCRHPPTGRETGLEIRLGTRIWLAPFERDLMQDAELCASPAADPRWWELTLTLRHVSGPAHLWERGAALFVNSLTRHLLRWRAASRAQETDCLARFAGVFSGAAKSRGGV